MMNLFRKLLCSLPLLLLLTGCGSEGNVKKGDKFFAIGEYFDAAAEYKKAYSHTKVKDRPKRGERAWKMAECYRRINFSAKALGAYQNAIRYLYPDSSALFQLARMRQMQGDYKGASQAYQAYLDSVPDDTLALLGLQGCMQAPIWKSHPANCTVKKEPAFNSRRTDFSPVLYGDDWDQLFITSTRPQATGDDVSGITGTKYADIFVSRKDDKGKWGQPEALESEVSSEYDDGACCFTPDEKTMYFTRCTYDPDYPRYAEIYKSERSDASWSKPQAVSIAEDTLSSYAHPAVSPDGDWLYFVSDMAGGCGGLDIWRMGIGERSYGAVENLGQPVNTPGDEMFPSFRPNGDLYFSSNGHPGMGGLDLFKAVQDSLGTWSVENLRYPMNSSGDDFGMTFEGPHNRGFFSSSRGDARGWDHIFSFEFPEVLQTVKGWVYEKDGYELPEGVVYMVGNDGTNLKLSVRGDGSFEQEIQPNVDYVFLGTCKGFLNHKESLRIDTSSVSNQYVLQFPLASITAPVLVRNVFYEFDSAEITPSSSLALDSLIDLLNENPNVTIELSSHCDWRGSDEYNMRLSQRRAESVVRYLIAGGIKPDRLTPVGYGESRPKVVTRKISEQNPFLAIDDTLSEEFIRALPDDSLQEICNALNRRTEFRVLRTTYGLIEDLPALKPEELDAILRNNAEIEIANGLPPGDSLSILPPDSLPALPKDSLLATKDALTAPSDTLSVPNDTLPSLPKDTLPALPKDTLPALPIDSLTAPTDTLSLPNDTLIIPNDTLTALNTMKKTIVALTGAGMSAESGISTFRDSGGLWDTYNVDDVATPEGWTRNPRLVTDFYNTRRRELLATKPCQGHTLLARLQENFDVHVITQNIDDLHERAGSRSVLHLHGELMKATSSASPNDPSQIQAISPASPDLSTSDLAQDGSPQRPYIVWFGEPVPNIEPAAKLCAQADIFLVIGTSLNVYPAAGLTLYAPPSAPIYLIDPKPVRWNSTRRFTHIMKGASQGMLEFSSAIAPS